MSECWCAGWQDSDPVSVGVLAGRTVILSVLVCWLAGQ